MSPEEIPSFIAQFLSHPVGALIIGAIISIGLISYFSNRWQLHQKGLEIRIKLVGRMSETIMGMIIIIIESMLAKILDAREGRTKLLNKIKENPINSNKRHGLQDELENQIAKPFV